MLDFSILDLAPFVHFFVLLLLVEMELKSKFNAERRKTLKIPLSKSLADVILFSRERTLFKLNL